MAEKYHHRLKDITDDGRLLKLAKCAQNGMENLNQPEDVNYHGWLNFYDSGRDNAWHEYKAKFTDGNLVEIIGDRG